MLSMVVFCVDDVEVMIRGGSLIGPGAIVSDGGPD